MVAENEAPSDPFKRYLEIASVILLTTFGIGFFVAWTARDAGYLMPAVWIGIAFSGIYLLAQIAGNIEALRKET